MDGGGKGGRGRERSHGGPDLATAARDQVVAPAGRLSKEGEEQESERSIEMPRRMRTAFLNWEVMTHFWGTKLFGLGQIFKCSCLLFSPFQKF